MLNLKVNLGDDESVMKANTHNAMLEKQVNEACFRQLMPTEWERH